MLREEDKKFLESQLKGGMGDANKQRMEKIARFKREKATKQKLKVRRISLPSSRLVSHLQNQDLHSQITTQAKPSNTEDETIDDELDREIILTTIDLFIQRTIENIKLIKDERTLLENMPEAKPRPAGQQDASATLDGHPPPRMNHQGPLLNSDGKILRPFVVASREAIRQGVFRPGHNLPTMTVEEYLDKEIERGNFLSGGTKEPEKQVADDNDEAAIDAETYKARDWDEFKDANPRGWGNRHNKG